ncbi:hypothetical protein MC7420_223 [Coleofasciculus chthonoplastes PCC 7420]|jgi:hypothetical protein|uniref:Uncharacterized protein n=1 Tax=Coleofasciculus chthonoplastes PCC 7420 TaxID=118168 RepID=B4VLN7_9CYAN|nr:hypothetical protein [Coleofasciculus chthonoplastes]EDX77086.1 hypothetical protein MC7420_223 [Coleofasciculus chthonoplastes PCC 7420]
MKFNSTVALTLILLAMMLGAGFVSAMWGFSLGHEALKGVTQPDVRPTKKLANNQEVEPGDKEVALLSEREILVNVHAYIHDQDKDEDSNSDNNDSESKSQTETDKPDESAAENQQSEGEDESSESDVFDTETSFTSSGSNQNLPLKSQDRGVTLEVRSANLQGGSLLLDVSLKNEGDNPVRFLYSFLNVTDDKGRALSAITEGLPGELPSNGEEFSGTVSIPTALLDDAKALSLTLTDYPDQKLKLKMSEIPVAR